MERAFVDTDILLDLLDRREPFYKSAAQLFSKADRKEITILVSALSFTNAHYVLRKKYSNTESRKALTRIKALIQIANVGEKAVELALASNFTDFEDGVQNYAAIENKASVIITRNLKDYRRSPLPVMTAEGFLKSLIS
jgi:predicted nucleic acid-binding protein